MLEKVFERAFQDGCGISLTEALSSPRYMAILAKHQAMLTLASESPEAIAFNAGHLLMGKLFNTLPEHEALSAAKISGTSVTCDINEHALIEFLGESLIAAARKCLPEETVKFADEWKESTAERQIEIARELWNTFRSENQRATSHHNILAIAEDFFRTRQLESGEDCILPLKYGPWDRKRCLANCQGKAQMLTAFARLCGARVLTISPLHHSRDQMNKFLTKVRDLIYQDVSERNLTYACEEFRQSLFASMYEYSLQALKAHDFHVGVCLEVKDGRWVMIDPHGLVWGVFPEIWKVESICAMLERYELSLPGLTLTQHDHGISSAYLKSELEAIINIIENSRRCEEEIRAQVKNIPDLINYFEESPQFDLGILGHCEDEAQAEKMKSLLSDPFSRQYIALRMVVGEENIHNFGLMMDPEFLEQRIRVWLSGYHAIAMNRVIEKPHEKGLLIHPVCEFNRPEYDLAVSLLNSLAQYDGCHNLEANEFFLRNSFDQLNLCNTLKSRVCAGTELQRAASSTLQALPFLHPNCRLTLGI